jgi:2-dehydropantoate 2-reductase
VNAAWNPICALTRLDDANFLRSSGVSSTVAEEAVLAIFHEVADIAAGAGYPVVTQEIIDYHMERPRVRLETGGKEPSMLTDVRFNRPIEVEAILGNAVRKAKELGVKCEKLGFLYALAKGLDYSLNPDERWRPILEQSQTK